MKYTDDKIQQQIEAYLNQDMTDLDRSRFEKLIHDDPELHEEVEMQESIMEAIRNERTLMLKANLSNTNISLWSTGLVEFAKIAAITTGLGLASLGGYYYFNNNSQSVPAQTETTIQIQKIPVVEDSPVNSQSTQIDPASEVKAPVTFEPKQNNAEQPAVSKSNSNIPARLEKSRGGNSIGVEEGVASEKEILEPGVKYVNPSTAKDIAIPTDGISNKTSLESLQPEVIIKRDNKDKFHYQFTDSKLILYAEFSDKLYEVLELNQNNEKQLFFAYDGKFFSLDARQTEISPLKEVQDKNLIQTLKEYQKRRN